MLDSIDFGNAPLLSLRVGSGNESAPASRLTAFISPKVYALLKPPEASLLALGLSFLATRLSVFCKISNTASDNGTCTKCSLEIVLSPHLAKSIGCCIGDEVVVTVEDGRESELILLACDQYINEDTRKQVLSYTGKSTFPVFKKRRFFFPRRKGCC